MKERTQRLIEMNPRGLTVYKVTEPKPKAPRKKWAIEPMRFIPHSGWSLS